MVYLIPMQFKLEDITSGGTYPPNNSNIIPSAPAVMAAANLSTATGVQRRISSGPNARKSSLNFYLKFIFKWNLCLFSKCFKSVAQLGGPSCFCAQREHQQQLLWHARSAEIWDHLHGDDDHNNGGHIHYQQLLQLSVCNQCQSCCGYGYGYQCHGKPWR